MTRNEAIVSLINAGYFHGHWNLDDDRYDGISTAFVRQAFDDWVHSLPMVLRTLRDLGGGKTRVTPAFLPEVFDCDNHTRSFANFIDEASAVDAATRKIARGNPAFGKFNFVLDGGTPHARNWMIDHGGFVLTFDPGAGDFTTQSESEVASIMGGESV